MDKVILSELYQKYHKELYLYLYSLCKNHSETEDLLQETFLKALLSLPEEHTNVRAWLYVVGRNLFLNRQKKNQKILLIKDTAPFPADKHSKEPEFINDLIREEQKQLLYQALFTLSPAKREILTLHYWSGFTHREIAAMMKLTPENVRVLAHRAKRELKQYMEVNGYDLS